MVVSVVCGDVGGCGEGGCGWRCGGDGVVVEMRLWRRWLRCGCGGCCKIKTAKE